MLPRLIVCLPGDHFSGKWLVAWNELHASLLTEYRVTCVHGGGNNIYEVRNDCVRALAQSARGDEPQHVLWIDSDNIVSIEGFTQLRRAVESILEASAVGAWYLMQMHYNESPLVCAGTGERRPSLSDLQEGAGRLLPVEYLGFGFLLMRYRLLDELGLNCFNPITREDGEFETDDVSFCLRAVKAGHKLFIHSGVHSPHLKLLPVPAFIQERQQAQRRVV